MDINASPQQTAGDERERSEATVVGIGASAGGLSALKRFFEHVPEESGLAFVVVVHLSPEHESHLAELLQPHVGMPVQQVTETTKLEANRVYVIPPNANLSAVDTHLRLSELEERRRNRAPIDHFFRTLAATHDGHAVAVVLTGTGSDGALGIKSIKEKGGLTVAQAPEEAEYDGMPQSAIATGMVDLVLPLREILEAILRFARTEPRVTVPTDGEDVAESERLLLQKVFAQVRARTGRDFSRYKRSTILRRIQRRMQLVHVEELDAYLDVLRADAGEVRALADDFLITVTNFFRDREVFEKLQEIIPRLFKSKGPEESLRVWSVGCATGEEAYSLAILLIEACRDREEPAPQIQVFASDLHEHSLTKAREGFYPGDIEADVSEERLRRFFTKEEGGYRIKKEVRELVVFAPHNLLGDPPFSKLDLIACRNVLIYLQRSIQQDVAELFHYALRPDGYLVLGTSETVDRSELFRLESKAHCLYRRRDVPAPEPRLPVFPATRRLSEDYDAETPAAEPVRHGTLHQRLVERYAPPSILIGPADQVAHLSQSAGRYLTHPGGEITTSAFKLVREELRIELRATLHAARERGEAVRSKPIPVQFNGAPRPVALHVRPATAPGEAGYVLVFFEEYAPEEVRAGRAGEEHADHAAGRTRAVQELEAELELTKERLQAIIEEYESSQEEMKASNEELQSMNEELRSTMEELETSKEELQSMNEELQTVNQENRHKVEELSQLSADLQNLMASTDIATLFLDREFRILRFTPKVGELFSVRMVDRGRPLSDLTHRLGYDGLTEDARQVLETLVPVEREVESEEGRWYLTRLLPYRTAEDRIEGVVITFVDITGRKEAEAELRRSEERFRAYVTASSNVVYRMSADWSEMRQLDGQGFLADTEQPSEAWMDAYIHPDDQARVRAVIDEAIRTKSMFELEHRVRRADGTLGWTLSRAVPMLGEDGEITEWFGAARDITERKEAEEELREAKTYAESIVETLHEPLLVLTPELRVQTVNQAFYEHFEVRKEETLGHKIYELGNGQWDIPELRTLLEDVLPDSEVFNDYEVRHTFEDIGERIMLLNARRLDHVQLILLGIRDITERKRAELELRAHRERLEKMTNIEGVGIVTFNADGTIRGTNDAFLDLVGYDRDDFEARSFSWHDLTPEEYLAESERQMEQLEETGRIGPYEKEYFRKDGTRRWMLFAGAALGDGTIIEYCIDVSARKRAEEALRQSEERFRKAIEIDTVGVIFWSADVEIREVNDAFLQMTGFDHDEVIGKSWRELTPEPHHTASERAVAELEQRGIITPYEKEYYRKDGSRWWGLFAARQISEDEVVEYVLDITEQKQAEQDLRELNETLEERVEERTREARELASRLTMAEQEERRRISQILHDDLQQLLYGVELHLSHLRRRAETESPELTGELEQTMEIVDQAVTTTRQLTVDLSPPILKGEGLAEALEWLKRPMQELHGLEVTIEAVQNVPVGDEDVRVLLFQIVRELLFNVKKHAAADRATVRLEQPGDHLIIHVTDEGRGFDVDEVEARGQGSGFGLFSARERLGLMGGRLDIESVPGEGTHVRVHAPPTPNGGTT